MSLEQADVTRFGRWAPPAVVVLLLAMTVWRDPASAQSVEVDEVGVAEVVGSSGRRLEEGGSATPFSLDLPDGAECPGDTAFEYWIVHSFMVPASLDATELEFSGFGPEPMAVGDLRTFREPLFEEATTGAWAAVATGAVERKGEPGPIVNVPVFSLAVYEPGQVPPGTYTIGIACVLGRDVGRVWTADIVVSENAKDEPGAFRWKVADTTSAASADRSAAPIVLTAGVAIAAGVVAIRRHRAPRVPTPRE